MRSLTAASLSSLTSSRFLFVTLYFLRHGQTALSREDIFCGSGLDPELTPEGKEMAQAFVKAITHRSAALGEAFHIVSPSAVTLRGYAEAVADWFGHAAQLRFLPWEEWKKTVSDKDASFTFDHIARSPNCSIAKARRLLEYEPRYRSLDATRESVMALVAQGAIPTQ